MTEEPASEKKVVLVTGGARGIGLACARQFAAQGHDVAPIPGTKRVSRLEENAAADRLELSAEQLAQLTRVTPPAGDHHNAAQMRALDR